MLRVTKKMNEISVHLGSLRLAYLRSGNVDSGRFGNGGGTPDSLTDCKLLCSIFIIRLLWRFIGGGETWYAGNAWDTACTISGTLMGAFGLAPTDNWVVRFIICVSLLGSEDRDGDAGIGLSVLLTGSDWGRCGACDGVLFDRSTSRAGVICCCLSKYD